MRPGVQRLRDLARRSNDARTERRRRGREMSSERRLAAQEAEARREITLGGRGGGQ
jgi:hypothetical protein